MTAHRCSRPILACAAAVVLSLAAFAPHDALRPHIARTPQLDQLIKAAAAEGELNVMWGGSSLGEGEGVHELEHALNREFKINIKVNYTPGPSMPQLATRIIREVQAGQKASTDLFLGIEVSLPAMIAGQVIEPVKWSADYLQRNHAATDDHEGRRGAARIHPVQRHELQRAAHPRQASCASNTLAEVFRPEWKGKLASTPYAAGFDRLALAYGDDKIRPIVKRMAEWAGGLLRCGEYERLATGEFIGLVLDCGQVQPRFLVENGGPVRLVPLDDALATTLSYFAVPKTSAHPNLAKLFAGFIATGRWAEDHREIRAPPPISCRERRAYKMKAKGFEARGLKLLIYTPDQIAPRTRGGGEIQGRVRADPAGQIGARQGASDEQIRRRPPRLAR